MATPANAYVSQAFTELRSPIVTLIENQQDEPTFRVERSASLEGKNMTKEFLVTCQLEVDAENPVEAARVAQKTMRTREAGLRIKEAARNVSSAEMADDIRNDPDLSFWGKVKNRWGNLCWELWGKRSYEAKECKKALKRAARTKDKADKKRWIELCRAGDLT